MTNYSGRTPPQQPQPHKLDQPLTVTKKKKDIFGLKTMNTAIILWIVLAMLAGFAMATVPNIVNLQSRCAVLAETISLPTKNGDNTCLIFYNKKWTPENTFMGALFQR